MKNQELEKGILELAQKRMFTMKIVDSDAFLDMPATTQCLYFHLNMRADDDGFIGNPKRIMKITGASEDDLRLLIAKRFKRCKCLNYELDADWNPNWTACKFFTKDEIEEIQGQMNIFDFVK